jgi:hypothetical protein
MAPAAGCDRVRAIYRKGSGFRGYESGDKIKISADYIRFYPYLAKFLELK